MFFCCPKTDQRQSALAKAMENADKMMGQHMDRYSLDIQNAIKANALNNNNKKKKTNNNFVPTAAELPDLLLGSNPQVTMDGVDIIGNNNKMMTATLQFHCRCRQTNQQNNCITCSGRSHTITGHGQDLGITGVVEGIFEIIDGKWTPGGNCYWIEKRMIHQNTGAARHQKQKQQQQEEIAFVMLNLAETSEATVTICGKNGTMNRTIRTIKLVAAATNNAQQQQPSGDDEQEPLIALCPSVRTVVDMRNKQQQQQQQQQ